MKIKVLGISASIRQGNSEYLLTKALEAAKSVAPDIIETEMVSFRGRRINPCIHCLACLVHKKCIIRDDFEYFMNKWLEADAIIYSVPTFHLGIPAHFKAFIDRLGQTLFAMHGDRPPKFLKVIGIISQGTDLGGGEELTILQLIAHAIVMGCIVTSGDPPSSYLGAYGWTKRSPLVDAFARMIEEGDFDAKTTLEAVESLGRRVAILAMIIKHGVKQLKEFLQRDGAYRWYLEKLGRDEKG